MQSKAADVASYLKELPPERRDAVSRLRALCVETLKGYTECMDYGMPCYKRDGGLSVAFASQRQYIALYGMGSLLERHRDELKGCTMGKGCIRFGRPEKMDFDLIRRMLEEKAAAQNESSA